MRWARARKEFGHDHDPQRTLDDIRGAASAARSRLRHRTLCQGSERLREDRFRPDGLSLSRSRTAASSALRGSGTSAAGLGRPLAARSAGRAADARAAVSARRWCNVRCARRGASAIAPCCWSAMRRTTAASASRRQRPAPCAARPFEPEPLLGVELKAGALDGARG
jgi:hypothetical protein